MNTNEKYKTVEHYHFDFLAEENGYPSSALMLIGCEDGRWFIQQEFGDAYSQFPGVLKSEYDTETQPVFYLDVDSAAQAAFKLIKQVFPLTKDNHLSDFLNSQR